MDGNSEMDSFWSLENEDGMGDLSQTVVSSDTQIFTFSVEQGGERLDRFLATVGPWSRAYVQQIIENGHVAVNGSVAKSSRKVVMGQRVTVDVLPPVPLDIQPEQIPLDIVYEDEDVLVVNKPRGMVVHPAPGHLTGTLVSALLGRSLHLSGIGGVLRPGIVHRIDKDTSGLLMVAKSDIAHHSLVEQLREHSVTRVYEAVVHGVIPHDRGTVDAPIGRDPQKRQQMAVVTDGTGRQAVTHFHVVERFAEYTYLNLQLETGRTHQIRVHMAYIAHPVAGDPVYARRDPLHLCGQALHAKVLGFTHPRSGERLLFEAPTPDVICRILNELGNQ